jgi:hypothetical protein
MPTLKLEVDRYFTHLILIPLPKKKVSVESIILSEDTQVFIKLMIIRYPGISLYSEENRNIVTCQPAAR